MYGYPTDKNDHCVRDRRREVMIFFENNKVLGVEANTVLNILEEIKKTKHEWGKTRGSVGCACVVHLSF